jgi:hypothetical protein
MHQSDWWDCSSKKTKPLETFLFFKLSKLHSEMPPTSYFLPEDALSTRKIRLSITLWAKIQMEWIKAFQTNKNIIYGEKIPKKKFKFLQIYFATRSPLFWAYLDITFVPRHRLEKKITFPWSLSFFLSSKKVS